MKFLLLFCTFFTIFTAQAACNPCVCGLGGEDPWPDHLVKFCNNTKPSQPVPVRTCITQASAEDIVEINSNLINSTNNGEKVDVDNVLNLLNFSIRNQKFVADFELNGKKERFSVSCTGEFKTRFHHLP